jgi:ParB family chromosome partitioning protein
MMSESITIPVDRIGAYVATLPLSAIKVGSRFRQEHGDLDALAASIQELGLLQPIGVGKDYRLIFGARRFLAHKLLGLDTIQARIIEVPSLLQAEHDENESRKAFTPSEQVAIAEAIKAEIGSRQGQRTDKTKPVQNFAQVEPGQKTREAVAKAAGFGNAETYRQAKTVVSKADPALVQAMDVGDIAISTAAKLASAAQEVQRKAVANPKDAPQIAKQVAAELKADAPPDGPQPKPKKSAWIGGGQRVSAVIRDLGYIKGNEDDLSPRSRERLLTSLKAAIARIEKAMVEQ